MKITLTEVSRFTKDKEGNPLKSKAGKPYTRLRIKCIEYGDQWLSGFDNARTKNWAEGDDVEIDVKQVGEYLNFEVPKPVVMAEGLSSDDRALLGTLKVILERIESKLDRALQPSDSDEELMPPF